MTKGTAQRREIRRNRQFGNVVVDFVYFQQVITYFFKQLIKTRLYNVRRTVYSARHCGGVAEWLKAPVLKTGDAKVF